MRALHRAIKFFIHAVRHSLTLQNSTLAFPASYEIRFVPNIHAVSNYESVFVRDIREA